MKTIEQIIQIAESLGWNVDVDDDGITFSQYTTASQDFSFYVDKNKDITEEIYGYYESYDPSEEAILWCDISGHGKNGAPYHLKDIIADMEEARAMVKTLYDAIDCNSKESEPTSLVPTPPQNEFDYHAVQRSAKIVRERLDYHFVETNGDWNIPKGMPFMREFLNEVRTFCDMALGQTSEEGSVLTPQLAEKINNHLHNLCQLDQHNELSAIFWQEQLRYEMDMQPWIDQWHACECDFKEWFAKLPTEMHDRVTEYYKNLLQPNL